MTDSDNGENPQTWGNSLNWAEFDQKLRDLVTEYAPLVGTVHENTDEDSPIDPDTGLTPPLLATDFLMIVAFEDAHGESMTAHYTPENCIRYRMLGLLTRLEEII